jgi:hypothetical protein
MNKGSREVSTVEIRYQAKASEDIGDLACAVMRSRVCGLARPL